MSLRRLLRPVLLPLLRRPEGEVEERARAFSVASEQGRALVAGVGRAFLGGYNAMLEARDLPDVRAAGLAVEPLYRPFFFEGAAMGYLPRSYVAADARLERMEADLLRMDPRFRYLYNVGIGFWYGFRHAGAPAKLEALARHMDPFYAPLCYDGFGFKVGFFDFPGRPGARGVFARVPATRRRFVYQGFGRALFFVCMDDDDRFQKAKAEAPAEHRDDMESGRSLAVAFTGIRQPEGILRHLRGASDDHERGLRLLGVTWALTARAMNDADFFDACLAVLEPRTRALLARLPERCREALERSSTYDEWRDRTRDAAVAAYDESEEVGRS